MEMSSTVKLTISIAAVFVGGVTQAYAGDPTTSAIGLIMAGLSPVAAYLIGLFQLSPKQAREARVRQIQRGG